MARSKEPTLDEIIAKGRMVFADGREMSATEFFRDGYKIRAIPENDAVYRNLARLFNK